MATPKEAPYLVEADDEKLVQLRQAYNSLKEDRDARKATYEEAEERLKVVKTAVEAELFKRTGGARLVDLRVPGVTGALRMRHQPYTRVNRDRLEQLYPDVYHHVIDVTWTWVLREVK